MLGYTERKSRIREGVHKQPVGASARERLDALRPFLGAVFLAAYAWASLSPGEDFPSPGTVVFLGSGIVLYAISVPWASSFHKGLALVSFAALGAALATGSFDAARFFGGLPDYFSVVAVLLVLSVAGYPIRAARYEAQIRALMAALIRRGASVGATSGSLGHVLGAVLDVGAFVLIDVILGRAAPRGRVRSLVWAGRAFSFAPLWTNLNVFTATTITLTGAAYPSLLAATLPFALLGLAATLLFAQREQDGEENEEIVAASAGEPLDRRAAAVLLYPVLLVAAVALVNLLLRVLALAAAIAVTVAAIVALIAVLAAVLLRRASPLVRLARETRGSLASSHAEFALFGSAGVLVLSLGALGALKPLGTLLSALPPALVAPALMLTMAVGFVVGIHVVPMVFLLNAAFPLDAGPAPVLWAAALLLGAQSALLLTPFSSAVTMLSRLTDLHPLEIGPKRNWRFAFALALAAALYLGLLTFLFF